MRDGFTMSDGNAARGASGGGREILLAQEKAFRLADTQVRPAALEVEFAAETTSVEPRVMQVLVALGRAAGEPVSREALIDTCWGGRVVTDGALNRSVAQLRKALRDPGIQVETIPKVGYRLQAAVAPVGHAAPVVPVAPEGRAPEAVAGVDAGGVANAAAPSAVLLVEQGAASAAGSAEASRAALGGARPSRGTGLPR